MSIQPVADPSLRAGDWLRSLRREHVLAMGIGGACALGLVLGAWAKPHLREAQSPMSAVQVAEAAPEGQMQILVSPPRFAPPAAPVAGAPLEVLPADMAAQAKANAEALRMTSAPAPTPAAVEVEPAIQPPPQARAGFDCREAQGLADQMVCGDPDLARQDRRLARAYAEARDAGVSAEALRAEQRDWMMIREDAAQQSPGALADVYDQRIQELAQMAAGEDR